MLAGVGGVLRGGGEDAERKHVDEILVVDASAVDPVDAPERNLPRRFERPVGHAERLGEVVGRTGRDDADGDVQPFLFHGVDHEIDRPVATRDHHQVDLLAAVERIGTEVDGHGQNVVAALAENVAHPLDVAPDTASAGLGVVKEHGTFHGLFNSLSVPAWQEKHTLRNRRRPPG